MLRIKKSFSFLSKPVDISFLLRISIYGLMAEINAILARYVTEILLNTGMTKELNPFFYILYSVHSNLYNSFTLIIIGSAGTFILLILWGLSNPKVKGRAEALAIMLMLVAFGSMVNNVLILIDLLT